MMRAFGDTFGDDRVVMRPFFLFEVVLKIHQSSIDSIYRNLS